MEILHRFIAQLALLGAVFFVNTGWASIAELPEEDYSEILGPGCPQLVTAANYGKWDPYEGREMVLDTIRLNDELEARRLAGEMNEQRLLQEGYIEYSEDEVKDKAGQSQPFRVVRLPKIRTGFYLPTKKKKPVDPKLYDGVLILMAGIGAPVSQALSMLEIAGTFNKAENPNLEIVPGRRLKLLPMALDVSLNGLGEDMPMYFGHPMGAVAAQRHAVIIAKILFPDLADDVALGGRSQGGANAAEYAVRYNDIKLAFALSASHPEPHMVQHTIDKHEYLRHPEHHLEARMMGFDIAAHAKSWTAHWYYTHLYRFLQRPARAPIYAMAGLKDNGYLQPYYVDSLRKWASQSPLRDVAVFNGIHNMWMRRKAYLEEDTLIFNQVVRHMTEAWIRHSPKLQSLRR